VALDPASSLQWSVFMSGRFSYFAETLGFPARLNACSTGAPYINSVALGSQSMTGVI
jgi:hypothetical protein